MEHLVFTLVTFVLFTALVGIISGKIVKNSDDQKTAKGYFLAGNGLGGFFHCRLNAAYESVGRKSGRFVGTVICS